MNEGRLNINGVPAEGLKMITIPQEEYKELLTASVKLEVIANFANADKYVDSSEVKKILDTYKEEAR